MYYGRNVVHVSCPTGLLFLIIKGGGSGGAKPPGWAEVFGGALSPPMSDDRNPFHPTGETICLVGEAENYEYYNIWIRCVCFLKKIGNSKLFLNYSGYFHAILRLPSYPAWLFNARDASQDALYSCINAWEVYGYGTATNWCAWSSIALMSTWRPRT